MTTTNTTGRGATASPTAVRAELSRVLEELGIDPATIEPASTLRGTFELDSTETVEVSLELGRAFGIKLMIEAGEDLSVAQVCDLVTRLVAEQADGSGTRG